LNGFAIVWLKYSTNAKTFAFKSLIEAKEARLSSFRTKILNHISTWFIQEACIGV
jgi:hypothetical protein